MDARLAPVLFGRPSWAFYGASLAFDFTRGRGWRPNAVRPAAGMLTTTRSSSGDYADNNAGFWQAFAANQPRITDKGLLVEENRTNSIRNNSMQGAVAGSPGTLPTNWAAGSTANLTRTISGLTTANGVDYIDIRMAGTTNATSVVFFFDASSIIAATNGQTWSGSMFVALVGGSTTNVSQVRLDVRQQDSGGSTLSDIIGTNIISSLTGTLTRFNGSYATNDASTAYVRPFIVLVVSNGAAVDITLRIGWPQLELGAFATSPIRTTSAAATRAADAIRISNIAWFNASEGTLFADLSLAYPANGVNQMVMRFSDNSYNNSIVLNTNSTGYPSLATAAGGVFDGTATSSSVLSANTRYKFAGAYKANDLASSKDGGTVVTDASATIPSGLTRCDIGSDHATANHVGSGYIRRVAYFPARLTNAQLQALTT